MSVSIKTESYCSISGYDFVPMLKMEWKLFSKTITKLLETANCLICHQIPQSIQDQFKSLGIPVTDFSVFLMLEKTLESPLDCKEIKPVNPKKKKINPQYALEELMVKLKLQYFGLLMWRADSLEKTPMLWKIKGKRRGQQKIRCLDSVTDSNGHESEQTSGDGEGQGSLAC